MSNLKDNNFRIESLTKDHKCKRLRNKNSYIDAFLERRKQAADFATEKRNPSGFNYTKSTYYINNRKIITKNTKNQKHNKTSTNSLEDKQDFYKTYNTLKKNLAGKNNSFNNIILIEKENNKYYLSESLPKTYSYNYTKYKTLNHQNCCGFNKHKKIEINRKNNNYETYSPQGFSDKFLPNEEITKKYNNIKHHSINITTKNKKEKKIKNKNNQNKNEITKKNEKNTNIFGNLKIEKTEGTNYYFNYRHINNINSSSPIYNNKNKIHNIINYKNDYNLNNNNYKSNYNTNHYESSNINIITSIPIKEKNKNNKINTSYNIYYEGTDNHKFYDSNKMSCSNYKYNYEPYKISNNIQKNENFFSRNFSEPKNLERNKHLYIINNYSKNNVDWDNNNDYKKERIGKNQINEISPIRTYARYDYEDNNDEFQNIEKIYESQSINGNSLINNNKFIYNIKLPNNYSNIKNNFKLSDYNEKALIIKSADFLKRNSREIIKDTPNTQTVSIVYKSQKYQNNKPIKNDNISNIKAIKDFDNKFKNKNEILEIKKGNNNININISNNHITKKIDEENKNIYKYKESNYRINNIFNNEEENKNKKEYNYKENKENNDIINDDIKSLEENKYKDKNMDKYENINKIKNDNNKNIKDNINFQKGLLNKYTNDIVLNNDINKDKKDLKEEIVIKCEQALNENKNEKEKDENMPIILNKINKKIINKNDNEIDNQNNLNNKDKKRDNIINEEYSRKVDQEQNYENLKEKYESFLRQKDEKEPNLQSKLMNSMLNSKDDSNLSKNNLIYNIKEKIQILKNNNKVIKENINYSTEIDDYFTKIKEKAEKNNLALNQFYQELLKKVRIDSNENKNININIFNNNLNKENNEKNENKKIVIKSNRLQNMMKNLLNKQKHKNHRFNNYNTNYKRNIYKSNYFPKNKEKDINELTFKNNFNNLKLSKYNKAPDIHLIADEINEDYIKIIDEDEYTKLKKKNTKSFRPINMMTKKIKESKNNYLSYRDRYDYLEFNNNGINKFNFIGHLEENYKTAFYPRIILQDTNHQIMPVNEII